MREHATRLVAHHLAARRLRVLGWFETLWLDEEV